jgi:hypothetical protein
VSFKVCLVFNLFGVAKTFRLTSALFQDVLVTLTRTDGFFSARAELQFVKLPRNVLIHLIKRSSPQSAELHSSTVIAAFGHSFSRSLGNERERWKNLSEVRDFTEVRNQQILLFLSYLR